jgi:DNA-binding FadR family transcriptional regulator
LAELTGNPVVALFLRILLTVWQRHERRADTPDADATMAASVARVHDRILAAIVEGDLPLARHRMHRHLEALVDWWE